MLRVLRLDRGVFEEVQFDPGATREALVVVLIVAVAGVIGQMAQTRVNAGTFLGNAIGLMVGWLIWSYLTYFVGVKGFGGRATATQMLRTMGFAYAPGVALVLGIVPGSGLLVPLAVFVWDLVTGVVAIRTTLDFTTGKAVMTVVTSAVVTLVAIALLIQIGL
jgi:hypothetical protein